MSLDLLLPIHTYPDGNAAGIASPSAAIAHYLGASVNAVILDADFPPVSSALGNLLINVPNIIGGAKEVFRVRGVNVLAALNEAMESLHVPFRSTNIDCFPGAAGKLVSSMGRYHDFVLLGVGPTDPTPIATAEAVLFGCGRPILLFREDRPSPDFKHIMIAWDGSRAAARAVSDAQPFISRADAVTIVSITDEKVLPDRDLGSRLASYLAHQDINSVVAEIESEGRPIGEALQDKACGIGANLIVMGGFAHSRLREFVLGGATKGIMKNLRFATLMSH